MTMSRSSSGSTEKEYDHVNWAFFMAISEMMQFGQKWIWWIRWCISTGRFSMLVNRTPSNFFQGSRGLRQREPLFLYLFALATEVLSCLLERAKDGGFLLGFKVRGKLGKRMLRCPTFCLQMIL